MLVPHGPCAWCMCKTARRQLASSWRETSIHQGTCLTLLLQDTEILLGDITKPESLQAIARRTKVMIAVAGPYQVSIAGMQMDCRPPTQRCIVATQGCGTS